MAALGQARRGRAGMLMVLMLVLMLMLMLVLVMVLTPTRRPTVACA